MDVLCFDFDGVICDSAPETALSAWRGCRRLWPGGPEALPPALQERFCRLRPVMHTGFEAIPLMRLIETEAAGDEALLADFPAYREALMAREGLDTARLQAVFAAMRDALIAEDRDAWLRANPFYDGMAALLAAALAAHPVFVVTTKQERFATLLLEHHGIALPPERIHGLERGRSKPQILSDRIANPAWQGRAFHFIEDRVETLHDVIATPALDAVSLYLAGWGYNTPAQRAEAVATGRIRVVSVDGFREALGL